VAGEAGHLLGGSVCKGGGTGQWIWAEVAGGVGKGGAADERGKAGMECAEVEYAQHSVL